MYAYQYCYHIKPSQTMQWQIEKAQVADLISTALSFSTDTTKAIKEEFLNRVKEIYSNLQKNWQDAVTPEAEELAAYEYHVQNFTQGSVIVRREKLNCKYYIIGK